MPPVSDCNRLPAQDVIEHGRICGIYYRQYLISRRAVRLQDGDRYDDYLREANRLYKVWEIIDEATVPHLPWQMKRKALAKLKDLVGEEAYFRGHWPPPVPLWNFETQWP